MINSENMDQFKIYKKKLNIAQFLIQEAQRPWLPRSVAGILCYCLVSAKHPGTRTQGFKYTSGRTRTNQGEGRFIALFLCIYCQILQIWCLACKNNGSIYTSHCGYQ